MSNWTRMKTTKFVKMNGLKLLLGYLILVLFFSVVSSHSYMKNAGRLKRFLNDGPIKYEDEPSCCICDDLANNMSCYERCRSGQGSKNSKQCPGKACFTAATLISGKFYPMSSCEDKATCQNNATRKEDAAKNGCDSLNKDGMKDGTICRYCCDPSSETSMTCFNRFAKIMNQTNIQNADKTLSSTDFHQETSSITRMSPASTVTNSIFTSTKSVPTSSKSTTKSQLIAELSCETCTNGTNCKLTKCDNHESYCENVVSFNNGMQEIIKKGCTSLYECKFDHSTRNSDCDPNRGTSTNSYFICHYCCLATNKSSPCNAKNIPEPLAWFDDETSVNPALKPSISSESSSVHTSISTSPSSISSEALHSLSSNTSVSSVSSSVSSATHSGGTLKNSMSTISQRVSSGQSTKSSINSSISTSQTPLDSSTSSNLSIINGSLSTLILNSTKLSTNVQISSSISPLTSTSNILKTTSQNSVKPTKKSGPFTLSPKTSVQCKVCSGPEFLCEKLYIDKECVYPNNYCLNTVRNNLDGTRSVNRRCDNFHNCYLNWFLGSSDIDKCRRYDERQIVTLDFDCTFCCIKDDCNLPLRPTDETLYKDD